MKTAAIR